MKPAKTKQADPTERQLIEEELVHIGTCFDATKLSEIISFLQETQDKFTKEGFSNLQLKSDWAGWDSPYELCIYGQRLETDSVYYERLAQYQKKLEKDILENQKREEQKRKKAEKEKESELALLAKLKEKYEGQTRA
jgi:hypothetical protein